MHAAETAYTAVLERIRAAQRAAGRDAPVRLLAVSKAKPADAIAGLAALGQRAFGENYLQEALGKMTALAEPDAGPELEWHFIGRLQSNKAREVARHFQWLQSLDRAKLIPALAAGRDPAEPPLQVLVQVNVDGEAGKSGCAPADVPALADAVAAEPRLRLRGLMAIPEPADEGARRAAFARMRALFDALRRAHPDADTLSMGMSADLELAIAEGATMVRVGTALFGPRG